MSEFAFQKDRPFDQRSAESARIMDKYKDRLPVVVEKYQSRFNIDMPDLDKAKYLVPYDINVGQFIYIIRKRIHLEPHKAIFLFVNNTLPHTSKLISEVYNEHRDLDGFLYFRYSGENAYG